MQRRFDKKRQDNRGFTLVELVIVVAILAILVGLLAPQYTKYVEKSRKAADADNLDEMVRAFQIAVADLEGKVPEGTYSIVIRTTEGTIFLDPNAMEINKKNDETYGKLYSAMCEALGDSWLQTELKSSNWQTGTVQTISVTIEVGADNSVSITNYDPEGVKQVTSKVKGED